MMYKHYLNEPVKDKLSKRTKLNLGCSSDYKEGWINVDIGEKDIYGSKTKVDVIHDLNKYPYPFRSEQFNYILSIGLIEHMRDLEKHVKELARISRNKSVIVIEVAHFSCYQAYRELYTHKFSLNCRQLFDIFTRNNIHLISKKLLFKNKFLRWLNPIINQNEFTQNFYERFLTGILPITNVRWAFKVQK